MGTPVSRALNWLTDDSNSETNFLRMRTLKGGSNAAGAFEFSVLANLAPVPP